MISRRTLLAGGASAALALPVLAKNMVDLRLPGGPSLRPLEPGFPSKGRLIVQRVHPPLLETPFSVFDKGVMTPNDQFYVRWHYPMPTEIDAAAFRLAVRGAVKTPLSLALEEVVKSGEIIELAAINQCAGNGRGQFVPRIPGAQWGPGAMGQCQMARRAAARSARQGRGERRRQVRPLRRAGRAAGSRCSRLS